MSNHTRRVLHLRPGAGLEAYLDRGFIHFVGETGGHSVQVQSYGDMNRASIHAGGFAENNGATEDQALTFRVIVETIAAKALEYQGLTVERTLRDLGHVIAFLEAHDLDGRTLEEHQDALQWLATQLPGASCALAVRLLEDAAWTKGLQEVLRLAHGARRLLEAHRGRLEPVPVGPEESAALNRILGELEEDEEEVPVVRPGRPRAPGHAIPQRPEGLERPEAVVICEECGGGDPDCTACDGDGVVDNPDGPCL